MKHNATLVINNGKEFANDIWQYKADWSIDQWKAAVKEFANTVKWARDLIIELDPEHYEGGDQNLYQLGDIMNFFDSIDVKKED